MAMAACIPYLRIMALPRPARPAALLADVRAFLGGEHRFKLLFGLLAIAMPVVIVFGFLRDTKTGILPGRQTYYVEEYSNDRSDAEIVAQQKIDQKVRDARLAEKRRAFQKVDNALTKLGI